MLNDLLSVETRYRNSIKLSSAWCNVLIGRPPAFMALGRQIHLSLLLMNNRTHLFLLCNIQIYNPKNLSPAQHIIKSFWSRLLRSLDKSFILWLTTAIYRYHYADNLIIGTYQFLFCVIEMWAKGLWKNTP